MVLFWNTILRSKIVYSTFFPFNYYLHYDHFNIFLRFLHFLMYQKFLCSRFNFHRKIHLYTKVVSSLMNIRLTTFVIVTGYLTLHFSYLKKKNPRCFSNVHFSTKLFARSRSFSKKAPFSLHIVRYQHGIKKIIGTYLRWLYKNIYLQFIQFFFLTHFSVRLLNVLRCRWERKKEKKKQINNKR